LRRPIVLIGLSGAGKTTVAPHAARLLGAPWCDLDQRVAADAGRPIAELFATHGEAHFRTLERAAMGRALAEPAQVVATGGGWAAEPGNIAAVDGRALLIYLSLSPENAAGRLAESGDRPLLAGESLASCLTELLHARERWYRLADIEVAVGERTPEAVAASIAVAARQYGGW
jgi:shikimate kinase